MELKEGMHVRTNHRNEHVIRKIVSIYEDPKEHDHCLSFDKPTKYTYYVEDNNFIAKENPIDLIEEGDYVNGILVERIWERNNNSIFFNTMDDEIMFQITNKTIESIVTKEQFESIKYEVK